MFENFKKYAIEREIKYLTASYDTIIDLTFADKPEFYLKKGRIGLLINANGDKRKDIIEVLDFINKDKELLTVVLKELNYIK